MVLAAFVATTPALARLFLAALGEPSLNSDSGFFGCSQAVAARPESAGWANRPPLASIAAATCAAIST